ncbi:Sexual development transcription factor NsdD [Rasamsonia emersonii CBS 393.64]|uniref:Sexual development transcription factor NsdD n=1 Tax=Rasamsonia emersonii (strain ATCC 16479 / CBS 393.64 / IMI 116815) TaxID=1408163 RepID=A0A0F4Z1Y1_RASE3|nr:Sexual development transcription factor NsdD [Rasamsonia emersonii CBS 393.64]KKA24360.1 Sexual development transcription factor NsdD [Rasamsonia emersonii CBS 393.64]
MATGVGVSSAPLVSPTTTMYPGPPPPYSYQTTSAPPAPRNNEKEQSQPQPPRQSLPSIHEALGNDNPLPYPGPASSPQHAPPPPLSTNLISRPSNDGPTGPPNPFSNNSTSTPFLHSQPGQAGQLPGEASRSSLASVTTQDSRKQSLPSLSSGKSPTQSSNTAATSVSTSQTSASYEYSAPAPASTMASPNGYPPYPQSYSYQSQPPTSQPASYDSRAYVGGGPWKPGTAEPPRVDDAQRGLVSRPIATTQPHSDSVKRQLDGYDVETSLNEIIDISTRTLDFARHYAARAHQTQRSGPILGSLPSVHEVDDLLQLQQRSQEALLRIRAAVLNQEHALAEQRAQRQVYKSDNGYEEEHVPMYQEDFKGGGGFAGADAKKRRGVSPFHDGLLTNASF